MTARQKNLNASVSIPPKIDSPPPVLFGLGFIVESLLDASLNRAVNFIREVEGLRVLRHPVRRRGAGDNGAYVEILEAPRQGELGGGDVQLFGDLGQLADFVEAFFAEHPVSQSLVSLGRETTVVGEAVVILAGQQTAARETPGGRTEPDVLQRSILPLYPLAVKHVVLRLLRGGGDEVLASGHLVGGRICSALHPLVSQ
jgi:hypothetical protein